jgi:hypothetical protein
MASMTDSKDFITWFLDMFNIPHKGLRIRKIEMKAEVNDVVTLNITYFLTDQTDKLITKKYKVLELEEDDKDI